MNYTLGFDPKPIVLAAIRHGWVSLKPQVHLTQNLTRERYKLRGLTTRGTEFKHVGDRQNLNGSASEGNLGQ